MRAETKRLASAWLSHEGRVLYALVDAADSVGLIEGTSVESQWRAINASVLSGASFESEAERLHEILSTLVAAGLLAGTWIEERWRAIQRRVMAPA